MVTLSYRNRLPKQIIANRQSTIDLQSSKQDERVSKKLNTNTNWNPHGTHNKHTQRERKSESVGTATSADVTRTTRRGDNCLPFEISSSYVVGGVSGDCTVCVCLSVGGGAWEWQRERARSNEHEFYYLSNVCVCVSCVRVRSAWHGTTREELLTRHRLLHYLSAPEMSCVSYSISIIVRFDSIRFDCWSSVDGRARFAEEVYGSNERTRLSALLYILIGIAKVARASTQTHTHRDTEAERWAYTHTVANAI